MTIHDDLREVMGLLVKAAPGEWAVDQDRQVYTLEAYVCNANIRHTEYDNEATAQAIAAAVNFLRQHGPALLARQEGEDALDAARYRWLRTVTPYRFKKIQDACIADATDTTYFLGDKFDAAIDAAQSGGGG